MSCVSAVWPASGAYCIVLRLYLWAKDCCAVVYGSPLAEFVRWPVPGWERQERTAGEGYRFVAIVEKEVPFRMGKARKSTSVVAETEREDYAGRRSIAVGDLWGLEVTAEGEAAAMEDTGVRDAQWEFAHTKTRGFVGYHLD